MQTNIQFLKEPLRQFCEAHHIRRLSLFGSVLRDELEPGSDIDVLVEFEPEHVPGFFKLAEMEAELTSFFGRKVDLRTPEDLSPYFRQTVLAVAEVQYVHE